MNVVFDCLELTNCLKNIKAIISSNNINNILSSVYINAAKDRVILQATNGSESCQETLPKAQIKEEGTVLLKCELLYEVVSKIHETEISLIKIEENIVQVKAGTFSCEINSWNESNFPCLDFSHETGQEIVFPAKDLDVVFEKLLPFVNIEHAQNYVSTSGVLVDPINDHEVECVATDTIRLVYYTFKVNKPFTRFVLNPMAIKLLRMLNFQTENDAKIYICQQKIYLETNTIVIAANLFDASKYPDLLSVLSEEQKYFFTIKKQTIVDALRLTNIFSSDNIIVHLENKNILVKSNDQDLGNCCCNVNILDSNIDKFQFRINHKKLLELLEKIEEQEITFKFNGVNSPFVLCTKDSRFLYLILPLKMF